MIVLVGGWREWEGPVTEEIELLGMMAEITEKEKLQIRSSQ